MSTNLVSDTSLNQLKQSNINADLLSGNDVTYNIEEGKSFNWQTALQTLSLLSSSSAYTSSSNYYSFGYNLKDGTTKVFVGFKVYDINGNLLSSIGKNGLIPLLEYSSSFLKNFNYEGFADGNDKVADVEGGLTGGQYQLKFTPKDNLVLEPCFSTLGVTVTYTCTQILSEKTIDNESYIIEKMTEAQKTANKIIQVITYNQLDIIPVNVGKNLLIPFGGSGWYGWESPYFSIVNSYKYTNKLGQTQSCTGSNMISIFNIQGSRIDFTAKHSSCDMVQTDEDNNASGCYWSTTVYYDCTICSNGSSDFKEGYNHNYGRNIYYKNKDENGHIPFQKCKDCGYENEGEMSEHYMWVFFPKNDAEHTVRCLLCDRAVEATHSFPTTPGQSTTTQHGYLCRCGYTKMEDHNLIWCTSIGEEKHAMVCSLCEYVDEANATIHNFELVETIKEPSCLFEGKGKYQCKACEDAYTSAIPSMGHGDYYYVETVKGDCKTCGYILYKCGRCDAESRKETSKGGHTPSERKVGYETEMVFIFCEPVPYYYKYYYCECTVCGETLSRTERELVGVGYNYIPEYT